MHFSILFKMTIIDWNCSNSCENIAIDHRCYWVAAHELFILTKEKELDHYVTKFIQRRLNKMYKSDLASSLFLNDISFWVDYKKRKKDRVGHFFQQKRVKRMIANHESLLIGWLDFIEDKWLYLEQVLTMLECYP
jgi:hypothetical protein